MMALLITITPSEIAQMSRKLNTEKIKRCDFVNGVSIGAWSGGRILIIL